VSLACVDREGKVSWQRNLVKDHGEYKILHGYGSSPMLHDGKLFIPCMHQGPSYLLAVDAKTKRIALSMKTKPEPASQPIKASAKNTPAGRQKPREKQTEKPQPTLDDKIALLGSRWRVR